VAGKRLLVMAGGTGGHVFPGLAVAGQLADEGWEILWLGTAERMEAQLVPQQGFAIEFIDIRGVRGNGLKRLLLAPLQVVRAIWQARRIMRRFKPDVVLGMGGYASGPGGVAARLCGIPLVLHEQNAAAGLTNRLLARLASRVLCAFPGTLQAYHPQVVGNPVRRPITELPAPLQRLRQHGSALRLLVLGGSLGAKVLNEVVPEAVDLSQTPVEVWHQTGRGNCIEVSAHYRRLGVTLARVEEFIGDMAEAYRWADVVVCRAGALTVSEVAAVGVAAIFVPLPHAVDDHQTLNARFLVDEGAAWLLPQTELDGEALAQRLDELGQSRQILVDMAEAGRRLAITDATWRVAAECQRLAQTV